MFSLKIRIKYILKLFRRFLRTFWSIKSPHYILLSIFTAEWANWSINLPRLVHARAAAKTEVNSLPDAFPNTRPSRVYSTKLILGKPKQTFWRGSTSLYTFHVTKRLGLHMLQRPFGFANTRASSSDALNLAENEKLLLRVVKGQTERAWVKLK